MHEGAVEDDRPDATPRPPPAAPEPATDDETTDWRQQQDASVGSDVPGGGAQ